MELTGKSARALPRLLGPAVAVALALALAPCLASPAFAAKAGVIDGGDAITKGGTYQLAEEATGIISVETDEPVVIVGNGAAWGKDGEMTSEEQEELHFDCTSVSGVDVTLKDVHISNSTSVAGADGNDFGVIGLAGRGNSLSFEGTSVIDYQIGGGESAAGIRVAQGDSLTIGGEGVLYFYKSAQGAGIGGSSGELNGDITFAIDQLFVKGSKQGAVIGAGSGSANASGKPGSVTFERGTYNIIANSRGGAIGGGAGSDGGSGGTTVYIERAASVNVNVDYSGAAIGGAGYKEGNDASGGTVVFNGGSLRIFTDRNALNVVQDGTFTGYDGIAYVEGTVNDAPMTAERVSAAGEKVYRCVIDTKGMAAGFFTVRVDGEAAYTGGLHEWGYVQESLDKEDQDLITSTPANWKKTSDTCLYLYLTGENHDITVNGAAYAAAWDAKSKCFTVSKVTAASCSDSTCPSAKFTDFNKKAWYHSAIDWAVTNGILSGFTDGSGGVGPAKAATRAQVVTVLYRMEGEPEVSGGVSFSDVKAGSWCEDSVAWAAEAGITSGYGNTGKFGPNDPVTREQLATFLYRYAQYKGFDVSAGEDLGGLTHPDAAKVSSYAVPALQWAVAEGVIIGYSDSGKIGPKDGAQRAQLATMLMRMDVSYGILK